MLMMLTQPRPLPEVPDEAEARQAMLDLADALAGRTWAAPSNLPSMLRDAAQLSPADWPPALLRTMKRVGACPDVPAGVAILAGDRGVRAFRRSAKQPRPRDRRAR